MPMHVKGGEGNDKHIVLMERKLCTCRAWELTGIPCAHAIRAMYYLKMNPQSHISTWYHKSIFNAVYQFPLQPVPGKQFMKCEIYEPIERPQVKPLPCRPRKKRIRAAHEEKHSSIKLSKSGIAQKCGICKQQGHNRSKCPNKDSQVCVLSILNELLFFHMH